MSASYKKTSLFSTRAKALLRFAEPARMDLTSVPRSSIPASIFSVVCVLWNARRLLTISADIVSCPQSLNLGAGFRLKLERELAVNDLFQRDVRIRHPRSDFNEGPVTHGQLPHALGHKIHQQS